MDTMKQIVEATIAARTGEIARNIVAANALLLALPKPVPLTRRQKVARWFRVRWYRVVTAWNVLRGQETSDGCCERD